MSRTCHRLLHCGTAHDAFSIENAAPAILDCHPGKLQLSHLSGRWDTIERGLRPCYGRYGTGNVRDISTLLMALLSGSLHWCWSGSPRGGRYTLSPVSRHILKRSGAYLLVVVLAAISVLPAESQEPPSIAPSTPSPSPASPKAATSPRFVVVLDAAHGGDDSGGQIGDSVPEKTVTLALSVRLRSLLAARGFWVVTTREGNVNLDSSARAQIADHATASASGSACLSIHASEAGSGVHIFVSALAPTEQRRFLAWKTAQSAFVARSLKLAGTVNSALEQSSSTSEADSDSGASQIPATLARASLPELDSMTCPAVAIEIAPIRDADRKIVTEVTDPQYQSQIVASLAAALLEWKTSEDAETGSHSARSSLP